MTWTIEAARQHAEEAGADDVHSEDLTPVGDEVRVYFSDDPKDAADCPWCVLGRCTRRVSVFKGGARLFVHGVRAS